MTVGTPRAQQTAAVSAVLRELGLQVTLLSPLLAHAEAVRLEADRLGLVAGSDVSSILSRHTGDSLLFALARAPDPGERWIDVGSGAGFPGLVLALCYPESVFTLVEPQSRRAGFLELQILGLGLENVRVSTARAEAIEPGFDVATARALAEPVLAVEALMRLVGQDGTVLVAAGQSAHAPAGSAEFELARDGIDSPGRIFMIAGGAGEA